MILEGVGEIEVEDVPGSTVGKNPPAKAGDACLIPGLLRSHIPWRN